MPLQNERKMNIHVIKENVSRETLKNKKNKKEWKRMEKHKDNENNK